MSASTQFSFFRTELDSTQCAISTVD